MSDSKKSVPDSICAADWAKYFVEITKKAAPEIYEQYKEGDIEDTMRAWFANAMMAMYDSIFNNEIQELKVENEKLKRCFKSKNILKSAMQMSNEMDIVERENQKLKNIILEIQWMARRYANGRKTYAVDQYNTAIKAAQALGIEFRPDTDGLVMAKDGMFDSEEGE